MSQRIVVAGGAGYIGSHVCIELLTRGDVVVLKRDMADPRHRDDIIDAVKAFKPDGAIHLAGLKAVGESVDDPTRYYRVNLGATLTLIDALENADAKTIVFSSSATVYGELNTNPVDESGQTGPTNPYGRTKFFIEEMLKDLARAGDDWRIVNLRYFNPVGAHPSGRIGEDPNGVPNNLFPFIAQVAVGKRDTLSVFGGDYPTRDGTGVRDYIHVCDLARGHAAALGYLAGRDGGEVHDINLGAGAGYSVLEAVSAFKRASNRDIPYKIVARRDGDVAEIYANAERAAKLLDWQAEKTIDEMCADHWRWQSQNPNGYSSD